MLRHQQLCELDFIGARIFFLRAWEWSLGFIAWMYLIQTQHALVEKLCLFLSVEMLLVICIRNRKLLLQTLY